MNNQQEESDGKSQNNGLELYVQWSPGVVHKMSLLNIVANSKIFLYCGQQDYQPEGGCGYTVLS